MTETPKPVERIAIRVEKILFATDFSEASARALPYAAAIARRFRAMLYVAHVIPSESYAHIPVEHREAELNRMRGEAEKQIAALLTSSHFNGIRHRVVLVHGELWPVLSSLIEEHDIDLVVAGTHGRHGVEKLLSGSMAEEISRLAGRPVLLVGPEVAVAPESEIHLERILYVTDFSPLSRRALEYAYALARAYSAHLYFLHVVSDVWDEPLSNRMAADAYCRLQMLEKEWPEWEDGIEPEFVVRFGPREELILETINQMDIQLAVMGVHGTTHPDLSAHLLGSLAYNVMSHARCPVLGILGATAKRDEAHVSDASRKKENT